MIVPFVLRPQVPLASSSAAAGVASFPSSHGFLFEIFLGSFPAIVGHGSTSFGVQIAKLQQDSQTAGSWLPVEKLGHSSASALLTLEPPSNSASSSRQGSNHALWSRTVMHKTSWGHFLGIKPIPLGIIEPLYLPLPS